MFWVTLVLLRFSLFFLGVPVFFTERDPAEHEIKKTNKKIQNEGKGVPSSVVYVRVCVCAISESQTFSEWIYCCIQSHWG